MEKGVLQYFERLTRGGQMSVAPIAATLRSCTVLGGSDFPFSPGETVDLLFDSAGVILIGNKRSAKLSYLEVADLSIAGPGAVTSGGGFVGGGFGVGGLVEGAALAGVLNAITTKTKIHTFIALTVNFGEVHLHYAGMEPSALRIALSGVYARLRKLDPAWLQLRLHALDSALEHGAITTGEHDGLRSRLLSGPVWPNPEVDAQQRQIAHQESERQAFEAAPKGQCPNCEKIIALHADECPHCKAVFGQGSAWRVLPVAG